MKLNLDQLDELAMQAEIKLPNFDVAKLQADGQKTPRWIHVGPGNIFRCFVARLAQELIEKGEFWPITALVPLDPAELDEQLGRNDLMTLALTLNPDGSKDQQVIGSLSEGIAPRRDADYQRLREIIGAKELSMLSFTITEKGYMNAAGEAFKQQVVTDFKALEKAAPAQTMTLVAGLLWQRFQQGAAPITLFSFDNFSHNGDKLRSSVLEIAQIWQEAGLVGGQFLDYLNDRNQVAFPVTVIDKITPRPSAPVADFLAESGWEDMDIRMLGRTPIAGFVNTEPAEYLVIEDQFASPVPDWEAVGVHVVAKETCDQFEQMKVTTCLNPLHTALAISGVLLGFETIDAEMRDQDLAALVNQLAWKEGLPVVVDPKIVSPQDFLREVLEVRFPNRYLPDDPYRIAMDTSQKCPIRYGETLKSSVAAGRDLGEFVAIPLVVALWMRYLLAVDDQGKSFDPSSDPRLEELQAHLKGFQLGKVPSAEELRAGLDPILSDATIFGLDLTQTALKDKIYQYFADLLQGEGQVRTVIHQAVSGLDK